MVYAYGLSTLSTIPIGQMSLVSYTLRCNDPMKKLLGSLKSLFDQIEFVYTPESIKVSQLYEATSSTRKTRRREVSGAVVAEMLVQLCLPAKNINLNYQANDDEFSQVFNVMDLYEVYRSAGVKNGSQLQVDTKNQLQITFFDTQKEVEYYNGHVKTVTSIKELYVEPENLETFNREYYVGVDRFVDIVKSIYNMVKLITSTNTAWYQWCDRGIYFYVLDNNQKLKGEQFVGERPDSIDFNSDDRHRLPRSVIAFIRTCLSIAVKKQKNYKVRLARGEDDELLISVLLRGEIGTVNIIIR